MIIMSNSAMPVQQTDQASVWDKGCCFAGLYVLDSAGVLFRFDSDGILTIESRVSTDLAFRLQSLLYQYRNGSVNGSTLGAILENELEPSWAASSLVFSDWFLNELFDVGRTAGTPSTWLEKNKTKPLYQGLELLLNKERKTKTSCPYFCPVLLRPEVDRETLREQYGIQYQSSVLFEVLDLSDPLSTNHKLADELLDMAKKMRSSQEEAAHRMQYGRGHRPGGAGDGAGGLSLSTETSRDNKRVEPETGNGVETCFDDGELVSGWILEWFSPFNELTDTQRDIIAGYETIRKVKSGTRLFENGIDDDTCIYLVEGTLELSASNGRTIHVRGGSRRSRLPISNLTPHAHTVTATSDASIVVFSQRLIQKVTEITRTYTGVDRAHDPETSTEAISNRVQAIYLHHVDVAPLSHKD